MGVIYTPNNCDALYFYLACIQSFCITEVLMYLKHQTAVDILDKYLKFLVKIRVSFWFALSQI